MWRSLRIGAAACASLKLHVSSSVLTAPKTSLHMTDAEAGFILGMKWADPSYTQQGLADELLRWRKDKHYHRTGLKSGVTGFTYFLQHY